MIDAITFYGKWSVRNLRRRRRRRCKIKKLSGRADHMAASSASQDRFYDTGHIAQRSSNPKNAFGI